MTDPGNPFTVPFGDLVAALEDRVRDGVEQPASVRFVVPASTNSFELPAGTHAVVSVAGLLRGAYTVFTERVHYDVLGNRLVWIRPDETPDPGSWLDVDYTYRERPAGLTDFSPGSVVGTLLRAVAYEMGSLYAQMDEAYRRAFVDQATGVALENVVALLGIRRKAALKATGSVTFFRRRAADARIPIPPGTRVTDRAGRAFVTTAAAGIDPGRDSVPVPVEALVPGPAGNVAPDTIVVMPTPPTGVDGVTNPRALTGGAEAEPDEALRERAKHALERAGNATVDAIRFALLGIDGVSGATVADHASDESIQLGEVLVRWAGDSNAEDQVRRTVESTRAAGVLARVLRITEVLVSGTVYLIGAPLAPDATAGAVLDRLTDALTTQPIGEPLSLRRMAAVAYDVSGVDDIAETTLTYERPGGTGPVPDTFLVEPTEVVRPAAGRLRVVLLTRLAVTTATGGLTLTMLDAGGQLARLTTFALDLAITVSGRDRSRPERPPAPLGRAVRRVVFGAANTATIPLAPAEYGYDPVKHLPDLTVTVAAAAYPGLAPAEIPLVVT